MKPAEKKIWQLVADISDKQCNQSIALNRLRAIKNECQRDLELLTFCKEVHSMASTIFAMRESSFPEIPYAEA